MKNIDNNKPVNILMTVTIIFYEELASENAWGSNDIRYELRINTKEGILSISEVGSFGDATLVKQFQDEQGITLNKLLENIQEIKDMTYKEFKEKVLGG